MIYFITVNFTVSSYTVVKTFKTESFKNDRFYSCNINWLNFLWYLLPLGSKTKTENCSFFKKNLTETELQFLSVCSDSFWSISLPPPPT